jgi:hypothetical protein
MSTAAAAMETWIGSVTTVPSISRQSCRVPQQVSAWEQAGAAQVWQGRIGKHDGHDFACKTALWSALSAPHA